MTDLDDDLARMFDIATPPRPERRARSRSDSLSPSRAMNSGPVQKDRQPLFVPANASPQRSPRDETVNEAWQGQDSALPSRSYPAASSNGRAGPRLARQYRDHNPDVSATRSRNQALAIFESLDEEENGGTASGARRAGATFDPLAVGGGSTDVLIGAAEGEPEAKRRRVMPKIDSARLLSDSGFPALLKESKRFRIKGKGHEQTDLNNLLSMYQLWAHGMFPRATFKDTVDRIERVCHQRDLQAAVRRWKEDDDEARMALLRGTPTPEPLAREGVEEGHGTSAVGSPRQPDGDPRLEVPAAADEQEDFDVDAMVAMAEAEAAELHRQSASKETDAGDLVTAGPLTAPGDDYEDDWAAMDD